MQIPLNERDGFIWYDGNLIEAKEAKIHLLNHSLHYGSTVFEGQRAYDGKIFKLKEHTKRFFNSANLLGYEIPYSEEEINDANVKVLNSNKLLNAYIRPFAFRGCEDLKIGSHNTIHVAIACWNFPVDYYDKKKLGLRLCFSNWLKPDPRSAPYAAKASGLYVICTLSKHYAEKNGYDDCLMLDYRGFIAEGTSSNFFMVKDQKLYTPIADCFLNGITRLTVIEIANDLGIEVVETHIKPEELANAQEAFFTGTASEITPIISVENYNFKVGEITKNITSRYLTLVRE